MDLEKIEKVMKLMESYEIGGFDYKDEGMKLRLQKGGNPWGGNQPMVAAPAPVAPIVPSNEQTVAAPVTTVKSPKGMEIKSPFVGTFYRSPSPNADAFVEVGDRVKKGDTLCIVEAMKLMNEIESEVEGVITDICLENGMTVEFGTKLFVIDKG